MDVHFLHKPVHCSGSAEMLKYPNGFSLNIQTPGCYVTANSVNPDQSAPSGVV